MSPRAAWRLESLGFANVSWYAAGKADWSAHGLPIEGEAAKQPRVKDIARADVPTCRVTDTVAVARERAGGWRTCIVVSEGRVVLGRMYREEIGGTTQGHVDDVMRPGPSTFRPNVSAREMLEYLNEHELDSALVTTPDGRLVGLALRQDVERAAEEVR